MKEELKKEKNKRKSNNANILLGLVTDQALEANVQQN